MWWRIWRSLGKKKYRTFQNARTPTTWEKLTGIQLLPLKEILSSQIWMRRKKEQKVKKTPKTTEEVINNAVNSKNTEKLNENYLTFKCKQCEEIYILVSELLKNICNILSGFKSVRSIWHELSLGGPECQALPMVTLADKPYLPLSLGLQRGQQSSTTHSK